VVIKIVPISKTQGTQNPALQKKLEVTGVDGDLLINNIDLNPE